MSNDRIRSYGLKARRWILLAMVTMIGSLSGCVTNPATGESEFSLLSRADEIALGTQGDQEIVSQFGIYEDAAVARYVDSLGQVIAAKSDDPSLKWTFRVLDSPVINAFALPGGFVYVTRGLLAYMGNEAQLSVVLGHEVGHVTARHTARRYTSQQLAGIGVGLGSILFEDIRPFLGAVETGLSLLFLANSRDDERQADELGVKYATIVGYEASEGSKFFTTLKRIQDQQKGGSLPQWASTHPDPAEREQTIINLAAKYAKDFPGPKTGTSIEAFVPRFDNIVYGEDPRQGYVSPSGMFYHPTLRFQFPVPSNWDVANFPSQVQMAPRMEQPDAAILLTATSGATPSQAASKFISDSKAQVLENQAGTVNGFSAHRVKSNITTEGGGVLTALSYFIAKDNLLYIFHGYSTQARFSAYLSTFESVFNGFNTVTDASVLNVQPFRVDVFSAPSTAPFSSLVQPRPEIGATVEELTIMNQLPASSTQVQAGSRLKQVK